MAKPSPLVLFSAPPAQLPITPRLAASCILRPENTESARPSSALFSNACSDQPALSHQSVGPCRQTPCILTLSPTFNHDLDLVAPPFDAPWRLPEHVCSSSLLGMNLLCDLRSHLSYFHSFKLVRCWIEKRAGKFSCGEGCIIAASTWTEKSRVRSALKNQLRCRSFPLEIPFSTVRTLIQLVITMLSKSVLLVEDARKTPKATKRQSNAKATPKQRQSDRTEETPARQSVSSEPDAVHARRNKLTGKNASSSICKT
ncbi:hypothetical protein IWZ00DRAFT_518531 [Phyllosticta capitalensis]